MKHTRGFTLIEMMIVLAIVAILAAIAMPNITDYLHKSRRSDGKTALLALQHAQERARANCPSYSTIVDVDNDGDPNDDTVCLTPAAPATPTYVLEYETSSAEGWYTLSVSGADAVGYTATATTVAGKKQAGDANCKKLILTISAAFPNGAKSSKDKDGNDSTGCW